jgi:hypothetical protein
MAFRKIPQKYLESLTCSPEIESRHLFVVISALSSIIMAKNEHLRFFLHTIRQQRDNFVQNVMLSPFIFISLKPTFQFRNIFCQKKK